MNWLCRIGLHKWQIRDDEVVTEGRKTYTLYSFRCRRPNCVHNKWLDGGLDISDNW